MPNPIQDHQFTPQEVSTLKALSKVINQIQDTDAPHVLGTQGPPSPRKKKSRRGQTGLRREPIF